MNNTISVKKIRDLKGFSWYKKVLKKKFQRHLLNLCSEMSINYIYGPVAQLVEQLTLNQWVQGSSPWQSTKKKTISVFFYCRRPAKIVKSLPLLRLANPGQVQVANFRLEIPLKSIHILLKLYG